MEASTADSDSEEEILVYADFKDIDPNIMTPDKIQFFKAIEMDSEAPIVQFNDFFFEGRYEHCMGTKMFFSIDKDHIEKDPIFDVAPKKPLKYCSKTRKILHLRRIFLNQKDKDATEGATPDADFQLLPHASTVEAALSNYRDFVDSTERIVKTENTEMDTDPNEATTEAGTSRTMKKDITFEYGDKDDDNDEDWTANSAL